VAKTINIEHGLTQFWRQ